MFRFLRYDVRLEWKWIEALREEVGTEKFEEAFGRKLTEIDVIRMRGMDDPTIIEDVYKLARIAAKQQVKAEHWSGELACWCNGRRPSVQPRQMILQTRERSSLGALWLVCSKQVGITMSHARSAVVRILNGIPRRDGQYAPSVAVLHGGQMLNRKSGVQMVDLITVSLLKFPQG